MIEDLITPQLDMPLFSSSVDLARVALPRRSISLCMIALNEEECIAKALENIRGCVDELIVVDGGSRDKTRRVARGFGAKVVRRRWKEDFSRQRNIAIGKARMDWVLVMDADETFEEGLLQNLQPLVNNDTGIDMFAFPRKNYLDGVQTSDYPDPQRRLWVNKPGISYQGKVHELPQGFQRLATLSNLHIIHSKTAQRQMMQNEHYRSLGATHFTSIPGQ